MPVSNLPTLAHTAERCQRCPTHLVETVRLYALGKDAMIVPMLQQPTSPMEYAMQKPDQSIHVNKPFLLICLFTLAILSATLFTTDDASAGDAAPAPVARDVGHGALPVCGSDALTLSAHCQPGRQA